MRLFRYPWQSAFDDLSVEDANGLPVASGACCVIPKDETFGYPFPFRLVRFGGKAYRSYELPDTDATGGISRYLYVQRPLYCQAGAYQGLFNESDTSSDVSELISESLKYVQRVEEIIEKKARNGRDSLVRVKWRDLLYNLNKTNWSGDLMRKPLIVELAEKQRFPLKEISRGAKRVLRRKRSVVRLSKAREFDKASLIRIAQLPGRKLAEKAGAKQRIPAVIRYETTDTLENRVVEHFCRLAEGEWNRNQRDGRRTRVSDEWELLVSGFVGLCKRVRRSEEFDYIQKLKSPCLAPNYTLEQNTNYRSVWVGYRKLINRQSEREECWAWARRLFLNRAYVFVAELYHMLFPDSEIVHFPYHKHFRARLSHQQGLWFDPESLPGPRVVSWEDSRLTAYLLSPEDVIRGFKPLPDLSALNADCYIISRNREGVTTVCPIYAFVGSAESESCREAARDLEETFDRMKRERVGHGRDTRLVDPIFIWSDFLGCRGLEKARFEGLFTVGIPVYNEEWFSPDRSMADALKKEFYR